MTTTIESLAADWQQAKAREDAARDERVDIERQMLELQPAKEEGAMTVTLANGMKVILTGKLTYKADIQRLEELTRSWPADIRPIKTETKADEAKLKAIRANVPKLWADIAPAVTVTPAKTGVSVKEKDE